MSPSLRPLVLIPLLLLAAGCSTDAVAPLDHAPVDAAGLRSEDGFLVNGPKGYGFRLTESDFASVILDGTHGRRCADQDDGWATATLTLTPRMVDEMWDVLDQGGDVWIDVVTYHRLQGDGSLAYSEQIEIQNPAIRASMAEHFSRSGWDTAHVETLVHQHAITRNHMTGVVAGDVVRVSATAQTSGDLGALCGLIIGGHAYWKMRGAVLRMAP